MMVRQSIPDFSFANAMYVGAEVSFFEVDAFGVKTATLATLYDAQTGAGLLANPQWMDSDGKFAAPVYIDQPVIAEIILANGVADHDTGVIGNSSQYYGAAVFNPPSVAGAASTQTTVVVAEALIGDMAIASFSAPNVSMLVNAQVTTAGFVNVTFSNISAGAIDLASGTIQVRVFRN